MTHPFGNIRQHDVERSRVAHIARGYATGGAVTSEAPVARKSGGRTGKSLQLMMDGGVAKSRADRPGRAKGGRAPKAKGNNVNVIIAPQGAPNSPAAGMAGPPGSSPPKLPMPPLAGPPPGMPMPGGPPGMPPRSSGGRTYATGGGVNSGTKVFEASRKAGTQIMHSDGKNDGKQLGRGKPITYATGGPVFAKPTGQHGPDYGGEDVQEGPVMKWKWENIAMCGAPRSGAIILVWSRHCSAPAVWTTSNEAGYVGPEVAGFTHRCYIEMPPYE